ncbi:YybS family protein [Bacillus haikouensis]|uniref:YybS family protein n=1 Tax=Bacillus haikouensis TaxID=1510468 RepID=UPI0015582851|nr:YybS family protein [Bacillus haikouensis]NQD66171.1 YybS family protein [Bacillus haikouensis]
MLKNTRVITEGALMLAIFIVMLLMVLYVPFLGSLAFLVLPLPLMLFSSRNSLLNSIYVFLGSLALSFFIGGPFALPVAFAIGSTAIVLGFGIKMKWDKLKIFLSSAFALLLNIVFGYVVSIAIFNMNLVEDSLEQSKATYYSLFEQVGQEPDQRLIDSLESSIQLIQTLMPTLFLGLAAGMAIVFIWVNFPILKRLGVNVPVFKPFREWMLPKSILWYYLIILVISMIAQPEQGTYLYTAIINVLYVLQTLMAIQGLSFLYFLGHNKGWSKGILVLITIISIPLLYLVRILGIIDLGFNLRERLQRKS